VSFKFEAMHTEPVRTQMGIKKLSQIIHLFVLKKVNKTNKETGGQAGRVNGAFRSNFPNSPFG